MGRGWKSLDMHARNRDIIGNSDKVSDGNE